MVREFTRFIFFFNYRLSRLADSTTFYAIVDDLEARRLIILVFIVLEYLFFTVGSDRERVVGGSSNTHRVQRSAHWRAKEARIRIPFNFFPPLKIPLLYSLLILYKMSFNFFI